MQSRLGGRYAEGIEEEAEDGVARFTSLVRAMD